MDDSPSRIIELVLPNRGLTTPARMLEQEAPSTCDLIWKRLPIEVATIHGWYSGDELYAVFPWEEGAPPQENTTVCTNAGDLFFYYSPWYHSSAKHSGEIAIFYGHDAIPMGSKDMMPGTLFARIASNNKSFADACESIWTDGSEPLVIRRGGTQ